MQKKAVVEGYTIIERKQTGELMAVLGHNPKAARPYGTWTATKDSGFQSFENGHYFSTFQRAQYDCWQRLAEEWERYRFAKSQRK